MTVYVDKYKLKFKNYLMCHMTADSIEELHEMANKIGLKKEWFQPLSRPHYDITQSKKKLAIK